MRDEERDNYVNYRLQKAEETYEVAILLVDNKKWNSAINRLYYSAYYAISALLVKGEIPTKTHSGVKSQFFKYFVKTGKIEIDLAKTYSDLFDWRQKGDYGDFFDFSEEEVDIMIEPTKKLIHNVKALITK